MENKVVFAQVLVNHKKVVHMYSDRYVDTYFAGKIKVCYYTRNTIDGEKTGLKYIVISDYFAQVKVETEDQAKALCDKMVHRFIKYLSEETVQDIAIPDDVSDTIDNTIAEVTGIPKKYIGNNNET